MLEAELPSFLVRFLAYLYYNLASHEVFQEEEHVLTMPKEIVFFILVPFGFTDQLICLGL